MALTDVFKLARLKIESFQDFPPRNPIGEIEVSYNPETFTVQYENVLQGRRPVGKQGGSGEWLQSRSKEHSLKIIFDGTYVGSFGVDIPAQPTVAAQVEKFLDLCYRVDGESHQIPYLRLTWNPAVLGPHGFECRLQSLGVEYTAFERDGAPLRAELTAKFVEAIDPEKAAKIARKSSPDLTHRRVVRSGDTLPALCRQIYGSAVHHVRVAAINGLDDLRALVPGQELIFPPFARKERG